VGGQRRALCRGWRPPRGAWRPSSAWKRPSRAKSAAQAGVGPGKPELPPASLISGATDQIAQPAKLAKAKGCQASSAIPVAEAYHFTAHGRRSANSKPNLARSKPSFRRRVPVICERYRATPIGLKPSPRLVASRHLLRPLGGVHAYLVGQGFTRFIGVGPGRALSGFMRRIEKSRSTPQCRGCPRAGADAWAVRPRWKKRLTTCAGKGLARGHQARWDLRWSSARIACKSDAGGCRAWRGVCRQLAGWRYLGPRAGYRPRSDARSRRGGRGGLVGSFGASRLTGQGRHPRTIEELSAFFNAPHEGRFKGPARPELDEAVNPCPTK